MAYVFGICLCVVGGLAVGVYLLPLKYSRNWAWENSWLVGAFFMYLIFPVFEAWIFVPGVLQILRTAPQRDVWMIYVFGVVQGSGALAFAYGITLMGLSLGYSLMISLIAVTGVMVPLVLGHRDQVFTVGGLTLMLGVGMLIAGVSLSGVAGRRREHAAGATANHRRFGTAILIALYSGIANSFFYFSFEFQNSLRAVAINQFGIKETLWPIVNVIPLFAGMFTINLVYCVLKMNRDGTLKNYWTVHRLGVEYLLAFSIGSLWFLGQGVCYTVGFTELGKLGVPVGAAVFMGAMIMASNLVGIGTGEWTMANPKIMRLLYIGIIFEMLAVAVVGVGNRFIVSR
jgi:L-rhamnose-H+ transport protein